MNSEIGGAANFRTTHWSVVLRAADIHTAESAQALESLCRNYWYPIYVFVRRRGHEPEEAKDLTQEFFARLLETESLRAADPSRGRFRTFLLGATKNFLAKERRDATRLKRGGGQQFIAWDQFDPEERYQLEPLSDDASPEAFFDRGWARTLVGRVLSRLQEEMEREQLSDRFVWLKRFLQCDAADASYAEVASQLGLSEPAVKSAIHRLRRRYAQLVREEITQTVVSPEDVEEEIRHLIRALAGS
jgi:RNA polymerase sigma-70 factor (ECF subfamily)